MPNKRLFIVSTPIGNLKDMTFRAVETLKSVELILCEDTRISSRLLKAYDIQKPLKSYNAYNEAREKTAEFFDYLYKNYAQIALISDSGTPAISDPGVKLVQFCRQNAIQVVPVPGASMLSASLSVCGFPSKNALFYGFLPNKKNKRKMELAKIIANEKKVVVFYESPYRLLHFFEILLEIDDEIPVCLCKELTKLHEEVVYSDAKDLHKTLLGRKSIKGEYAVVVNNLGRESN